MSIPIATEILLRRTEADEVERLNRYKNAWIAYYNQTEKPLTKTPSDPKALDNVRVAYPTLIVDTTVSWLFGEELRFELDPEQETEAEQFIRDLWLYNEQTLFLQGLAQNGAVCGHWFLKIQPREDKTLPPSLINLDPATVRVIWDALDKKQRLGYIIEWDDYDPVTKRPLMRRQRMERQPDETWLIYDEMANGDSKSYVLLKTTAWPYPFAPIVDGQHFIDANAYYGIGELEADVLEVSQAINRAYSNNNRIMRLHGHPRLWAKGVDNDREMPSSPDEMITFEHPDAELNALEMSSDMRSNYGHLDRLTEALFRGRRVPMITVGDVQAISNLSGSALALYMRPLLQKMGTLRLTYGSGLVEVMRRCLAIAGHGDELRPTIIWPEILPKDMLSERQSYQLDVEFFGVSQQTIQERLGYDPAKEKANRTIEDAAALEAKRAEQSMMAEFAPKTPPGGAANNGRS
jgi:hypothetical protein